MILTRIVHKIRAFGARRPLSVRYGIDGVLTLGAVSMAGQNANLFAMRLGAGDFQLALVQFLPQAMNLLILIPAGLFTDSLGNKRRMLSYALFAAGLFFALAGVSAFIPVATVYFFLIFLALANTHVMMGNLAWQSYFPEVVSEDGAENRNAVLTFRARMTMIVSIAMPLIVGFVLAAIPSHEGKIAAHQAFYAAAAALIISNVIHIRSIKATNPNPPKRIAFAEIRVALGRLSRNKPFIIFVGAILFFHMTWHADWTLFFIGQANYLQMNEILLAITPVCAMVAQLVTLKYWSRRNTRTGVEKPLTYGMLGLSLSPVAMILGVAIGGWPGIIVFYALHTLGHMAFASITLNLFQCLLKVVDPEYRSLSISVYTLFITASNAIMPLAGVALYHALGANYRALQGTFVILFVLRIIAAGLWVLRLRYACVANATKT
jgi:MFS family permease